MLSTADSFHHWGPKSMHICWNNCPDPHYTNIYYMVSQISRDHFTLYRIATESNALCTFFSSRATINRNTISDFLYWYEINCRIPVLRITMITIHYLVGIISRVTIASSRSFSDITPPLKTNQRNVLTSVFLRRIIFSKFWNHSFKKT